MVRELLGNIKGPQGAPGKDGVDGNITQVDTGFLNKVSLSAFTIAQGTLTNDIETGVMEYEGATWQMTQKVFLYAGTHTVRVEDYETSSVYYGGQPYFRVAGGDYDEYQVLVPQYNYKFEIPEDGTYDVQIRVSNSVIVSGWFRGLTFVEGEYCLGYFPSLLDIKAFINGGS